MKPGLVTLTAGLHDDKPFLFVGFTYNYATVDKIKQFAGAFFDRTLQSWLIPFRPGLVEEIKTRLDGIAEVHYAGENPRAKLKDKQIIVEFSKRHARMTDEFIEAMNKFRGFLFSRRYSANTIKTYSDAIRVFFNFLEYKPVKLVTNDDLIIFNNHFILANNYSASYQNQMVNSIKLFFELVDDKLLQTHIIHRPKREKTLPNVLSIDEVRRILNALVNLKHRTMLSLIYSCGLRCGELLKLTLADINAERNLLIVKQGKGRKDRIVPLSNKTIELLREYYRWYRPATYLFEGLSKGTKYDERSLQQVMKLAVQRGGVSKPATLHWLRHSYATHLLENGTDIRYIQEILGHSSSRTTEIYTHVSTMRLQKIESPFDKL